MQKHLQPLGNSLALILEKPLLKLLGIGRETPLRITTDGRRLVIEPIFDALQTAAATPPAPVTREVDALSVLKTLLGEFSMSNEQVKQLHHCWTRMFRDYA